MAGQQYPFSKSRYFPHKRMRSSDFIQDQEYIEGKLAFFSRLGFGKGAALGLEVQRIDGDSLLVSPGFAVDGCGRWLIVDEPAICRLRTIPGFDTLCGETALLWLTYCEELTDAMFVPGERDEVREYASARERFSFCLTDMRRLPQPLGDHVLFSDVILFEDGDLRIRQVIPKVLPAGGMVQLRLVVESFCLEPLEIYLRYAPQLPGFLLKDGRPLLLERTLRLNRGETTLALTGRLSTTAQAVLLSLPEHGFLLEKRGIRLRGQCEVQEELPVTQDPLPALRDRLLSQGPQELWTDELEEGVPIAGLRLLRYGDQTLLSDAFPLSKGCRAELPCLEARLRHCQGFFPKDQASVQPPPKAPGPPVPPAASSGQRLMSTGVVTLNTGLHLQEGNILCSDETAHELGPGTVFVEFGVENIYPAPGMDRNYTDLLLGDASLFAQASGTYDCSFDQGVRVHPEKGTFELAVRLKGELRQSALRLRWFAWRPGEDAGPGVQSGTLLRLEPDVTHIAPGGMIDFVPIFAQGTGMPCDFMVLDKHSGTITPNGIYTAPKKEGLYQICAQIRDMPETRVSAFAIVRTPAEEPADAAGTL